MLSKRVRDLAASPTLRLAARAKELSSQGFDVVSLTVGEPDWETYEHIREAGIQAINTGLTRYTPAAGLPELRAAIARQATAFYKVPCAAKNVTVTSGAKFILFAALQSLLDPGDEIVMPIPYWVSYTAMADLCDAKSVLVATTADNDFKITAEDLEKAITKKTKIFLLNSPSNPTGLVYSRDELAQIAEVLRRHPHVVVVSDDIYNQLMLDDSGLAPHLLHVAPDLNDRVIAVNGVSKAYAMTGWRIGWATGPEKIIGAMANYQSQALGCAPSISQVAATAAVLDSEPDVAGVRKMLKERREIALKELLDIAGFKVARPEAAFYLWVDVKEWLGRTLQGEKVADSRQLCEIMVEKYHLVTVPGQEFGIDGFIRLSFAVSPETLVRAGQKFRQVARDLGFN